MNLAFLDLLALALFAILGAQVAEELGRAPMIIVTMGVIAGIGCIALLRIAAIIKKIRLPAVRERG